MISSRDGDKSHIHRFDGLNTERICHAVNRHRLQGPTTVVERQHGGQRQPSGSRHYLVETQDPRAGVPGNVVVIGIVPRSRETQPLIRIPHRHAFAAGVVNFTRQPHLLTGSAGVLIDMMECGQGRIIARQARVNQRLRHRYRLGTRQALDSPFLR